MGVPKEDALKMTSCIICTPPNIIRVSKFRRMKWAWHVARMGDIWNACKILVGKPEEKRILEAYWSDFSFSSLNLLTYTVELVSYGACILRMYFFNENENLISW
jgi:hypothetical protein